MLAFGETKSRVCAVRSTQFVFKFVTEPIGISFVIIETDAYQLGSVFRPIVVWFDCLDLIGFSRFETLTICFCLFVCLLLLLFFFFNIKKKSIQLIKKICSIETL